jgi:hypothetical protein
MKLRCQQEEHHSYANYGGRGIEFRFSSVMECCLWIVANMGLQRDMEVDRANNEGHYEPGNLRWATRRTQMRNTRVSVLTDEMFEWAEHKSPYSFFRTQKLMLEGHSIEAIISSAKWAVLDRRKNWMGIHEKLVRLGYTTSPTPVLTTDSP